jgi:exopolysaccharide biosynthesis polyprenyl glycosylphosphotransferase
MQNFIRSFPKFKFALAFADVAIINIAFFIATTLYKLTLNPPYPYPSFWVYLPHLIFSILVLFYFHYANLYKAQVVTSPSAHRVSLLKASIVTFIGFIAFQFFYNEVVTDSRAILAYYFVTLLTLFWGIRPMLAKMFNLSDFLKTKLIIVGAGVKGKAILNTINTKLQFHEVIGFLDDNPNVKEVNGIPCLGKIEDAHLINENFQESCHFLMAIDNIDRKRFFEIFSYFTQNRLHLSVSSIYLKVLEEKLSVDFFDTFGIVKFGGYSEYKLLYFFKRFFDISLTVLALILLSPVFIVIAILVKFSSKGPIIYSQIRVGQNGETFKFYKFRSMYLNSDKDKNRINQVSAFIKGEVKGMGGSTKIVNKSNITPIGHFIRKYSLDELPQLFNVLKGDMSLVGPRPCILPEWNVYQDWQKLRLNFIPGCTGIWQVSGRSEVDFEESVLMDIYYIQNYTPWLDLKILLKTIPVMLLAKGGE